MIRAIPTSVRRDAAALAVAASLPGRSSVRTWKGVEEPSVTMHTRTAEDEAASQDLAELGQGRPSPGGR